MPDFEVNRRDFVLGGLVAGVLPLGAGAGAKDANVLGSRATPARLHKLLVDRSISESVRFGSYAGSIADEVVFFDGDLTSLWINQLRSQWPTGPRPIAGLTAPNVRMVLEQLGRDHDARVVFSAEHRRVAGAMRHKLVGCDTLLESTDLRGGADWVADMAKHVAACPHELRSKAASFQYDTTVPAGWPEDPLRLVTWVIAPVLRNAGHHNSETASS